MNNKQDFIRHWYDVRSPQKNTPETIRDLHRSIRALSDKLYSTKTHFLLELIQNADDNSYPEGVEPELTFRLCTIELDGEKHDCLCIHNNEIGFSENNLEALFQVGASSKKKKDGFIGEKGIGFKSVYSISDCPYIFSVGYQFKLPKECNMGGGVSLGYIVPVWVEKPPEISMSNTNIILPINTDSISIEELSKELFQINPELILFLKKLNKITIIQEEEAGTTRYVISRIFDNNREIVTLDSEEWFEDCLKNRESTSFLYKVKEVEKPDNINIEEREGVLSREICIAIPLDDDNYEGKLFAYLPVKDGTGFPFLINADFILTSSRENVASNKWNDWLWNEIPAFFAEIIEDVMCDDSYSIEQKRIIFSHIPTDADDPKFQKLIDPIYDELKQTKCVLAYQSNDAEFPENCRLSTSKVKDILSILKWSPSEDSPVLISNALESYNHILKKLDIPKLSKNDVLGLFSQEFVEQLSNQNLISFYMFLRGEDYSSLDNYPWVPVTDGNGKELMVGAEEEIIYYPLESANELSGLIGKEFIKLYFLRESFYKTAQNSAHSKEIFDFLQKTWTVYPFSKANYCVDLNNLLNIDFPGSDKQFIEISEYIFKEDKVPDVFITNNGRVGSEGKVLVVSPDFDENGWGTIWGSKSSRGHITYIVGYSKDYQQKLLSKGVVKRFPLFEIESSGYPASSAASNVLHKARSFAAWSRIDETKAVFPVIPSMILSGLTDKIVKALIDFWTYTLKNYESYDGSHYHSRLIYLGLQCEATYQNRGYSSVSGNSDLTDLLMKTPWLPTTKGLQKPGDVWRKTEDIEGMFGDAVPYLEPSLSLPREISSFFGIKDKLTWEFIYKYLLGLAKGKKQIENSLANKLYKICDTVSLSYHLKCSREVDPNAPLIYVQRSPNLWYSIHECLWNDDSVVLGSSFQYLSKKYPIELKSFFIDLGVLEKPDADTYLKCWEFEQEHNSQLSKPKIAALYQKVFESFKEVEEERWAGFVKNARLINSSGVFASSRTFLFNDNASLAKIFEDAPEINIAFIPSQSKASLQKWFEFYNEFSVKPISQCVVSQLAPSNPIASSSLEQNNSALTPHCIAMMAAWLHETTPSDYPMVTAPGSIMRKLEKIAVYDSKKPISIEYQLNIGKNRITRKANTPVFLDLKASVIICNFNDEDWKRILASELAQYLSMGRKLKGFDSFIETVLGSTNIHRIEDKNWQIPSEFEHLLPSPSVNEDSESQLSNNEEVNTSTHTQQPSVPSPSGPTLEQQDESVSSMKNATVENKTGVQHPESEHSQSNNNKALSGSRNVQGNTKEPVSALGNDSTKTPSPVNGENTKLGNDVSSSTSRQENKTPEEINESTDANEDNGEKEHHAASNTPQTVSSSTHQSIDQDTRKSSFSHPAESESRQHNNECSQHSYSKEQEEEESDDTRESAPVSHPDYTNAINNKFSRQGKESGYSESTDELPEEEPLTQEMRQRRQTQVANEIRNMQTGSASKKEEEPRRNTGRNSSGGNSQELSDSAKKLFDMPDNAFSLEEEMVLRRFAKGNDFRSNMRVMLAITHKNNPMVRAQLEQHYHGRCQICHHTWQMANGKPFWIAAYILPRSKGGVAHSSNAICLCAEHFAQWLHGTLNTQIDFTEIIKSIPEDDPHPQIQFELARKTVTLTYNQRHFCDLRTLLQMYEGNNSLGQSQSSSIEQNQSSFSPVSNSQLPQHPVDSSKKKNQTFSSFEELSDYFKKK